MKKKRLLALLVAVVMVFASLALAACANETPADPEPAPQEEPAEPDEEPAEEPDEEPDEDIGVGDEVMPEEPPEAEEDAAGGTLLFATTGVDGRFTPITASNVYDAYVNSLVFDSLISNDEQGIPSPWLATHWETDEDRLVYTFFIDERATFSDGAPVTAHDVEFTYNAILHEDYDGPRSYVWGNLESVEAIDDHTVAFTFIEAGPVNIWTAGYGIVPMHLYDFDVWDDFLDMEMSPVGSGRFLFDEYRPMEFVRLIANPNHWHPDRIPQVDEILMLDIEDEMLLDAFALGEIHFAQPSTTIDNYNAFMAQDGLTLEIVTVLGYQYMQFNTLRPTLEDHRVRQALMYALDREAFIDIILGPMGSLNPAGLAAASWAYPHDVEFNYYSFDLDRAAELMEEAGWEMGADGVRVNADGVRMELVWPVYTEVPWPGVLSELAYDSWGQLGVDLTIELMDFGTVQALTSVPPPGEKDFCVYVMGFSLAIDPSPHGGIFDYTRAFGEGGFNASGFYHARAEELITLGMTEFDMDVRREIYAEWAQIMNYYVPTVIIANRGEMWAIADGVHGVFVNTFQNWTTNAHNITVPR